MPSGHATRSPTGLKRYRHVPFVAVAQLVLTLTAQPGVGQVVFVIGEDTAQIPRADNTLTNAPVSRDDFIELLAPA